MSILSSGKGPERSGTFDGLQLACLVRNTDQEQSLCICSNVRMLKPLADFVRTVGFEVPKETVTYGTLGTITY